jgi:hypothetical protein
VRFKRPRRGVIIAWSLIAVAILLPMVYGNWFGGFSAVLPIVAILMVVRWIRYARRL